MPDPDTTVEQRIMDQLPHGSPDAADAAVNVFQVYDAVDTDPATFTDALRRLQREGEVFKPKTWHVARI